jgi:hypothetical protein
MEIPAAREIPVNGKINGKYNHISLGIGMQDILEFMNNAV